VATYVLNRVTFPDCNDPLRTDESFIEMTDKKHHRQKSPFLELSLGTVSQFPIDYMHFGMRGAYEKVGLTVAAETCDRHCCTVHVKMSYNVELLRAKLFIVTEQTYFCDILCIS